MRMRKGERHSYTGWKREEKRGADEKHPQDAGNIWFHIRRPRKEIACRHNSYVLIYFMI